MPNLTLTFGLLLALALIAVIALALTIRDLVRKDDYLPDDDFLA